MIGVILVQWSEIIRKGAGWTTLAVLLTCSPWIGSSRYLTFYPMILLFLTVGTIMVWSILREQQRLPISIQGGLLGIGVGLCFIADARGILWGGWLFVISLGWLLTRKYLLKKVQGLLTFSLSICISWLCA